MKRGIALPLAGIIASLGLFASGLRAQESPPPSDARFVASTLGQVYYWIGCDAWKRLSASNRIYFTAAPDAEAAGYRPSTARGCAPQLDTALIVPRIGGQADCTVSRIIDGDTFQCEGGSRVRLLLVDAHEIGQSAWADSATLLLERLMPVGSSVRLEFDVQLIDRNQRILAHVFAGGAFINRELVRRGLAVVDLYAPNVRHLELLRAAADSARVERRGIWAERAFYCSPAEYRAGRCRRVHSAPIAPWVRVRITSAAVEIFHGGRRVAPSMKKVCLAEACQDPPLDEHDPASTFALERASDCT